MGSAPAGTAGAAPRRRPDPPAGSVSGARGPLAGRGSPFVAIGAPVATSIGPTGRVPGTENGSRTGPAGPDLELELAHVRRGRERGGIGR